jgi:hypothetical protein
MSGYGIVGANDEMEKALVALGWRQEAPGFYLLHASGLGDVIKTVHALEACTVPAGCRLFSVGDMVDLGRELGADPAAAGGARDAGSREDFPFASPFGDPAYVAGAPGVGAMPFTPSPFGGSGMQGGPVAQPQRPVDPLEQMLADGYFDDGLTDDAAEAVRQSQETEAAAGSAPEAPDETAFDDDDDYSLEMMKVFGLH